MFHRSFEHLRPKKTEWLEKGLPEVERGLYYKPSKPMAAVHDVSLLLGGENTTAACPEQHSNYVLPWLIFGSLLQPF